MKNMTSPSQGLRLQCAINTATIEAKRLGRGAATGDSSPAFSLFIEAVNLAVAVKQ